MPPASHPTSVESNNIQTLGLVPHQKGSTIYQLPDIVPRISDYTGNAGAVFVADGSASPSGIQGGFVSIRRLGEAKREATAYLTGLHLNFLGLTVGGIREVSQTCGVNVCGSGTVLHCQPYTYSDPTGKQMFLQIGARVAFELPPFDGEDADKIGQKRFYEREQSELFANDGIRVRRSRLMGDKTELTNFVQEQCGGQKGLKRAAQILGFTKESLETDKDGKEISAQEAAFIVAYACEKHYTFGISLTNLKKAREANAVRVMVSPV